MWIIFTEMNGRSKIWKIHFESQIYCVEIVANAKKTVETKQNKIYNL